MVFSALKRDRDFVSDESEKELTVRPETWSIPEKEQRAKMPPQVSPARPRQLVANQIVILDNAPQELADWYAEKLIDVLDNSEGVAKIAALKLLADRIFQARDSLARQLPGKLLVPKFERLA